DWPAASTRPCGGRACCRRRRSAMNKPPLLRAEHLSKTYPDGQVNALVDVNLSIEQGEYVAIMGPSGCGKSTLRHSLGALDRPSAGVIYVEGRALEDLGDLDQFRSQKLGFVFQSFYLLPTLTALENVQLPMFEGPLSVRQRVRKARELLDAVGMGQR